MEDQPDYEWIGTPKTGTDYSQLLLRRTMENLYEALNAQPTDEHIADQLGTTSAEVRRILRTKATFGKGVFENLAGKSGQTLSEFMRELIRWG